MSHDLILGTAGHIDHGKTSLIRALTGIDCDRLPEEKARGITIDIGFAHLTLGEFHLGIVDVPGHERFVKNMLAGVTGIDIALLIIAADDSIMPQTREHLDILKLLGVKHGVIALTKADLVDETSREVVELEIRELVKGSFLENAPIVPTSTVTGMGIEELKREIEEQCVGWALPTKRKMVGKAHPTSFRLPIDRSFTVAGHGTVVTGSVISGSVAEGDELAWHKTDGTTELVRVRSLNNHGKQVTSLHRGQRGAINLAGVPHDAIQRGQELATPGYLKSSKVLTVRLHALASIYHPIKHRLPCRLHLGTAEVMASVSILDADHVDPGQWSLAQLFLESPITAVWGQPFIVRDSSAEHTLGGGQVLQPHPGKLRRRHIEHLERAEVLWNPDATKRASVAAWFAAFHGLEAKDLIRDAGVQPGQEGSVVAELVKNGELIEITLPPSRRLLIHADRVKELAERLLAELGQLHQEHPLMTNHDRSQVLARLDYVGEAALLQAIVDRLIQQKQLVGDARRIARADFKPKLSANQRKLKDKIVDEHHKAGLQPPEPGSFVNQAAGNAGALKDIYEVACAEGYLVKLNDEIYLHSEHEANMRERIRERLASGGATVSEIRELLVTTRKYAVPICEYLDRIGMTRREGDLRVLVKAS